jgi:N-formylglutamate amidohydrolase
MRPDLTKSQKRRIRELAGTAYDRELSRELTALEDQFGRWRRGEIDSHELSAHIHRYHQGPNRHLFLMYTGSHPDLVVASAIARGILTKEEATTEVVDLLRGSIAYAGEEMRAGASQDESENGSAGGDPTD